MSIQVHCKHCQKTMNVKESAAGHRGLCPFCKHEIAVPQVTVGAKPPPLLPAAQVTIKKRLLGGYTVSYNCPRCTTGLVSKLDEAGKHDTCPECGTQLIVPGEHQRSQMIADHERHVREAQEREQQQRQIKEQAEAERHRQEHEREVELARIQTAIAEHPFNYPIEYTVDSNGLIEYRDHYFEVIHHQLRVNPDLDISEGRLIIKSIQLFKKHVNMTKKENAQQVRETKAYYRDSKPRIQKSRHKGFVAGFINIAVDSSRASHTASRDNAVASLEARKAMYDEVLLACDHLIHQLEMKMAQAR